MTDKLPDVWGTRDYPVLLELTRRVDAGEEWIDPASLCRSTGLEDQVVQQAVKALARRGLVDVRTGGGGTVFLVGELSGYAYLLTGLHPDGDDAISRLIDALRQAAEQTTDPEEKSRLRRLADNAGAVSRDVLAAVLATVITGGVAG